MVGAHHLHDVHLARDPLPGTFHPMNPTNLSKSKIEERGRDWAEKFAPVRPLEDLVKRLGGTLLYLNGRELTDPDQYTLNVYVQGKFDLYVPGLTRNKKQKKGLIAHELGHYFLHSEMGQRLGKFPRYGEGRLEAEANWFGRAFLGQVPPRSAWERLGEEDF